MSEPPTQSVRLRDGREVVVRSATVDDGAAVLAFAEAVSQESQRFIVSTPEEMRLTLEQERDWIASHASTAGALWLIAATDDGEVVGSLQCRSADRRRLAHVAKLGMTVREAWRGVGLGTAMMGRLIEWAEANPAVQKLNLAVFADNERAIRLYRRCGFMEEGRLVRQTQREPGEYVDDLVMYRWVGKAGMEAS